MIDGTSNWRYETKEIGEPDCKVTMHRVLCEQDGHTYLLHEGHSEDVARAIAAVPALVEDMRDISRRCPDEVLASLDRFTITLTGQTINRIRADLLKIG